jgi:hypothetical protein
LTSAVGVNEKLLEDVLRGPRRLDYAIPPPKSHNSHYSTEQLTLISNLDKEATILKSIVSLFTFSSESLGQCIKFGNGHFHLHAFQLSIHNNSII